MEGVAADAIRPPGDYRVRAEAIGRPRIYGTDRTPSPLHQLAGRNQTTLAYMGSPGHRARRFLVNLVYHAVLQAGLSPLQKFMACHLVANGIDELTGSSWQEIFASGAADA